MAAQNLSANPHYTASLLYPQPVAQPKPVRVDPFAPLPTSFAPVQNPENPSWPEEVQRNSVATPEQAQDELARTASRKRRVSGTGRGPRKSQVASYSQPRPAAPEAPTASPATYQDPYPAMNGAPFQNSNTTSFAARARGLAANESPPTDIHPEPEVTVQSAKPKRRESTRQTHEARRPDQPKLLEASSGREVPQPSNLRSVSTQQPQIVDIPAPRRVAEPKTAALGEQTSVSESSNVPIPPPVRSNTRKSSAGQADSRKEWAPDRSPLQKLEVKLNDISKEEKRARVEKAEQKLRESKANEERRRGSQGTEPVVERISSRRAPARQNAKTELPLVQSQGESRSYENDPKLSVAPTYVEDTSQQKAQHRQAPSHSQRPPDLAVQTPEETRSETAEQQASQPNPARTVPDRPGGGRGVRFHGQDNSHDLNADPSVQADPPSTQTYNQPGSSRQEVSPQERLRQDELVMGARTSKEVPSQQQALYGGKATPSGKGDNAAAFGGAPDPVSAPAARGHGDAVKYEVPPQSAAGIAARQKVGFGGDPAGPVEAPAHHKHHLSEILRHGRKNAPNKPSQLQSQTRHLDEWRQGGVARLTATDLVVSADGSADQHAWWEKESSGTSRASEAAQRQKQPGLKSVGYAEDYGQENKSFDPPLYLKCGPLLRYTGLKRDKLHASRMRGSATPEERESWRGSVLIVTIDSESDYITPPTLRLYPEPIELLPPPPQHVNGDSGHSLPPEYIDPIAGLPKLSRTGTTVYVKPVEDLEPEVDLSRVETDDGLFEEMRTAAVPTSYGKPDPRLSQPQSDSKKQRFMGKSKSKSQSVRGIRLHAERGVTFWRFNLEVELSTQQTRIAYSINNSPSIGFWVPAKGQSMNVMFHSCNGFSMSVK